MRLSPAVFVVFAATATLSAIQTPQQVAPGQPTPGQRLPPRDAPAKPGEPQPKGTATLRGQVFGAETGAPLRRAQVRAMSQDGRGGGVASTDAQGRFEIKELIAGRYSLSASKAGYVTMQFGQRRADQPGSGTILDILDNQLVEKIVFSLSRGGVITGRVVDEFGDPVASVQVSASRSQYMSGSRRLMQAGSDASDDQGSFRVYGLPPGEYIVSGTIRSGMMGMPTVNSMDVEGYAPTYFPGTPNAGEAQRVTVRAGQEAANVNFALSAARMSRISGRVITSAGEPPAGPLMVMVMMSDTSVFMPMMTAGGQTRADGTFQLGPLSPGAYTISARPSGMPNQSAEFGEVKVTVAGEDVNNLVIATSRGAIARGAITTDDGTALPIRPQQVRLMATMADPTPMPMGMLPPVVNDDWTFEMPGLFDKRILRAAVSEAPEWTLKSVLWRDQDISDTPIEFVPGQTLDGVQFVFTRKTTVLTGAVADDRGRPALDAAVIIFPADSSRWTYLSRYMRTARPDQEGRYQLRNMPPSDDYLIVAVRDLEDGRWSDPEFLQSVRDYAARVALREGETRVQDLKVLRAQ